MDASQDSSLVERKYDYDVFLNHGLDTGSGFADILYRELKDAGILIFRGKDVPVGEEMVDFSLQVIKRSKISIPVLSPIYAGNKQCLDEVVQMLECRKRHGHSVFPIYYQIDSHYLRNLTELSGNIFTRYERQVDPGRIGLWK